MGLASAALSGILSIIDKKTVSKYTPTFASFGLVIGIGSLIMSIGAFLFAPVSSDLMLKQAGTAFASGLLWGSGLWLYMFVLRTGEVSRVSPVFHTYPALVAVLGVTFLGERLSWIGWIAVMLTIAGAIIISSKGVPATQGRLLDRFFALLMLASLLAAAGQIVSKYALNNAPFWDVFAYRNIGTALPFFALLSKGSLRDFVGALTHPVGRYLIILGEFMFAPVTVLLSLVAVNMGPVSVVSALLGTRPVFIFLYSAILSMPMFKMMDEPLNRSILAVKATAIAMVVAGLWALSVFKP